VCAGCKGVKQGKKERMEGGREIVTVKLMFSTELSK
jgi:hypothetical protein